MSRFQSRRGSSHGGVIPARLASQAPDHAPGDPSRTSSSTINTEGAATGRPVSGSVIVVSMADLVRKVDATERHGVQAREPPASWDAQG
jgi:hypothetical protein